MKRHRSNPFLQTREAPAAGEELRREFELDRAAINEQARTVELSFSSEAQVERYFGIEILDHSAGAIRLGRMQNGAALLVNHDRADQVGVVESVTIGQDRRGRAVVRFGRSARAQEIFQDVVDGIRRLVSVGYRVHRTVTTQTGGVETVRVVDWEPFEISLVSIPADDSVGVGRGEPEPSRGPNNNSPTIHVNREQMIAALRAAGIAFRDDMTDDQLRALLPAAPAAGAIPPAAPAPATQRQADPAPAAAPVAPTATREGPAGPSVQEAIAAERRRVAAINTIASQALTRGITLDAARAVTEGTSVDAFRASIQDAFFAQRAPTGYHPGAPAGEFSRQEHRDLSGFSIVRGIQSLLSNQPLSGIEAELHREAQLEAQRSGIALEGNFAVPSFALAYDGRRRDMSATGGSNGDAGGTLVPTMHGPFIDLLYARLVLRGLGAQFLTGLTGNVDLPKLLTGATIVEEGETDAAAESSPTTGKVQLSPTRIAAYVELSRQLLLQSNPSVESIIRNDLATALALAIDAGGIATVQALTATVVGGANGLAPTWAHIVELETDVATANADIGTLAYLTNPKVRGKLKTTSKAGTEAQFVWAEGDTPLNGYRAGVTTQVPSNLTKGDSNGVCSAIMFGNWADLIIGQWGGLDIMANPYIKDIEGLVRITANTFYDAAIRRSQSFSIMKDALTA